MQFSNDPNIEIARVFLAPDNESVDDGKSILYLLRRDLQNLYGKEMDEPSKIFSPLLTTLGIMVGFELLSKYWSGNHITKSTDLENFLKKVAELSPNNSVILTQLRHSLAHGYCLQTRKTTNGKKFAFCLDDNKEDLQLIIKDDSKNIVNIWKLKKLFVETIKSYHNKLAQSADLQGKFVTVNANLGELKID
jgi:hypothetical protein